MSIDAAILNDPKIREVFANSLRTRRNELLLEVSRINAALDGMNDEGQNSRDERRIAAPQKVQGQRRKKGEAGNLILALLRKNSNSSYTFPAIAKETGLSPSTAWRALQKLEKSGKVTQPAKGLFYWEETNLPVASGNGKGAET